MPLEWGSFTKKGMTDADRGRFPKRPSEHLAVGADTKPERAAAFRGQARRPKAPGNDKKHLRLADMLAAAQSVQIGWFRG
jgi:hypothetical protein